MIKAFWTWDPVSSGTYRAFDEPYAEEHSKWFFDKSVWQKMFRTMNGCGFDAFVLANTHPFPFMADLARYPGAKVIDEADLLAYHNMHHWILETALDYDIAPYLAFFNIYYPGSLIEAMNIPTDQIAEPNDFAIEYTQYCLRSVLETFPEISGFIADISGVGGETDSRARFIQQAVLDTFDSARPDACIYLRGIADDPEAITDTLNRRGNRPIHYIAPYTQRQLVYAAPDQQFTKWIDEVGPEFVVAEFDFCNFEPWTSFSFETAEEIISDLEDTDCHGLLMHPLSEYEWPHTSDNYFKYQWQRDLAWYSVWGGISVQQMLAQGQPKWLLRNHRLVEGFNSGSRILELLSLYFAGDRNCGWRPQFCSVTDEDGQPHLLSIADMLRDDYPEAGSKGWWQEVTGDPITRLGEYLKTGTAEDSYGPDELIEELADLSERAIAAGEKGMRNASGEKELPSFSRDALCMGRLGEFYIERLKAALSYGRGEDKEALEHMARALGLYKEIRAIDSSHRNPFRIRHDHTAAFGDWSATVKALEAEYEDAFDKAFENGDRYGIG